MLHAGRALSIFYNARVFKTTVIHGKKQLNLTVGEILYLIELLGRERTRLEQKLASDKESHDNASDKTADGELRRIIRMIDRLRSQAS
jgi:hypothetical protein